VPSDQERAEELKERLKQAIQPLSKQEIVLFNSILRIEHGNLHLQRPRVKHDMLKIVQDSLKTLPRETT
jgi:hypothetical protein